MFERTKSGLSNRAKFYGCDLICFVEGASDSSALNPDSTFWGTVFSTYRQDLKIKCIARGGKTQLESLAQKIVAENITENLVAMDSDYDDFVGDKIDDYRVLYTYGYSWENDILSETNFANVICAVMHQTPPSPLLLAAIRDELLKFSRHAKRLMQADYLALCAKGSIIPREAPGRIVQTGEDFNNPYICPVQAKTIIRVFNQKTKITRKLEPTKLPTSATKYFVGKVFSFYLWRFACHITHKLYRKIKLSKEHFRDIGLQVFQSFLLLEATNPIAIYHRQQCARIQASTV